MKPQKGAAILMAMLTVTLVAALAAAALWQQWRSVEVEAAQRARVQSGWILVGALDWARLILREDVRTADPDHLGEPWAVPLEEARLATFFATGTTSDTTQDDVQQSFISGQMFDLQGRLNVRNLVEQGKVSPVAVRQFSRLFELLGLPPSEVEDLAENLRLALDVSPENSAGAAAAPLLPQMVSQLGWLGLSNASIAVLAPFITILPQATPVNLNTAPVEVIFASIDEPDMALARRLVTARAQSHFKTLGEAARLLGDVPGQIAQERHSVSSRYFEVRGVLRLEDVTVTERSLVLRDGLNLTVIWRERGVAAPPRGARRPSLQ